MKNTLSVQFRRAVVLFLTVMGAFGESEAGDSRSDSALTIATRSARHDFTIELAQTPAEMERGLMFRTALAPDRGMLFLYADDRPVSFWMKNTYIPLDLFFIDRHGAIVQIAERAVPMSTALISSKAPVRAVLELNGGTAQRLGIAVGDRVEHPAFGE
jgi:uncharacterized membrane protein (UPF0127 family)